VCDAGPGLAGGRPGAQLNSGALDWEIVQALRFKTVVWLFTELN